MKTNTKTWSTGTGSATIQYGGQGDGQIIITSDANNLFEARSMQIAVETTDGSGIQRIITINQAARARIDISNAVVTASNQTYSGSAKTPTPTVTLNGTTIPSTGYDVVYSNNTNAGTATITVTGKGEYTGTAIGTFIIAKASRTLSFTDSYAVVAPSGNVTLVATPSAGSGDGNVSYSSNNTSYATVNSSGKVTAKTTETSVIISATISGGQNYADASASYILYIFATTHDFAYTGSVQDIVLPPGQYKLQCWGAQGGENAAGYIGGKGGYSEGVLSLTSERMLYSFVGGKGGASGNGGWNGGGGAGQYGASGYNTSDEEGSSYFGGGGGATDFALVTSSMSYSNYMTNRSNASLLSRIIVAGGGSGGANCSRRKKQSTTVEVQDVYTTSYASGSPYSNFEFVVRNFVATPGVTYYARVSGQLAGKDFVWGFDPNPNATLGEAAYHDDNNDYATCPSGMPYMYLYVYTGGASYTNFSVEIYHYESSDEWVDSYDYRNGYAGGGTNGAGYSSTYQGKQNAAGSGGSFGQGANQTTLSYRYCSGAGGGGWYGGGGGKYSDSDMNTVHLSGGGSGWVNIAANAGNRPSGYTGLELDSGTTYAGNTSFPSTGGGTEIGHSGNGYARITRLE